MSTGIDRARERVREVGVTGDAGNLAYCGALERELIAAEHTIAHLLDVIETHRRRTEKMTHGSHAAYIDEDLWKVLK